MFVENLIIAASMMGWSGGNQYRGAPKPADTTRQTSLVGLVKSEFLN